MECLRNRAHSRSYTLFFALFVVATPISIIGFSYFKIFMKFRQSKKNIKVRLSLCTTLLVYTGKGWGRREEYA